MRDPLNTLPSSPNGNILQNYSTTSQPGIDTDPIKIQNCSTQKDCSFIYSFHKQYA